MDDTTGKIVIAIISILFGLIAGQGLRFTQAWWNTRKLKKSLIIELEDIRHRLSQMSDSYKQALELYAHKTVHLSFGSKLSHPIYTKHYTDVFLKLTHTQRNSYELIHGLVDSLNKALDTEFALTEKQPNGELFERWGATIFSQYSNIHLLWWHINFHLDRSDDPNLIEMHSEDIKHFRENATRTERQANDIISHAKKLTLEQVFARQGVVNPVIKSVKKTKENN
jgi:hypothetical protein